ncbi:MAG: U32 family peptidase [Planctomycetes bacterium]|nr:U32 family peptidase [Planctomycetota bacterium]MBM4064392.1 U32 family peptidase [Planctomycetota bacterium]
MSYHSITRKRPELLSPASNPECFFAAIHHGADAIYFGLKQFSARTGAQNFTLEEASAAVAYAHKNGKKVYIALNTLIKTNELASMVDLLLALEEIQPDALIIQDLGLYYLIRSQFPHFALHASTQMVIHNLAGAQQAGKMGFKRIVLARELSIDEIRNIVRHSSIEIEVFVHGALCYSYSGMCLFSSMQGGRSGNRGRCAQPCRVQYESTSGKNGYFFSMKDLHTLSLVNDLMAAGVHSFKIEGRMKSPEYVAIATNAYRKAIDGNMEDIEGIDQQLKTVFGRQSTHSYLITHTPKSTTVSPVKECVKPTDMVNPVYPANIGLYAGKVIDSQKGRLTIKASVGIGIRDLLQIFDKEGRNPELLHIREIHINGKNAFHIPAGAIATINSFKEYPHGTDIYLVSSQTLKEAFASKIPKKLTYQKIPVCLKIKINQHGMKINGEVFHTSFPSVYDIKLEMGKERIIKKETVEECFSRLGNTPFELRNISIDISQNYFIPLSVLNTIRRDYFQKLFEFWEKEKKERKRKIIIWIQQEHEKITPVSGNLPLTNTHDKNVILSLKTDNLHYLNSVPLEEIYRVYIALPLSETDKQLFDVVIKYRDKIVFSLPFIMRDNDIEGVAYSSINQNVSNLINLGFRKFQIANLGALSFFEGKDVQLFADYPLYCVNPLSILALRMLGISKYTHSPEDDFENIKAFINADTDTIIYQDTPLFISESCIWANMKNKCPGTNKCNFKQITVENEFKDRFIAFNKGCKTVVVNEKPFSLIHLCSGLQHNGQQNFRIDLCYKDYSSATIRDLFTKIKNKIPVHNSTTGNFKRQLL